MARTRTKYSLPSKNVRKKRTRQGMGEGTKTGGKYIKKYRGQGGPKRG